MILCPLCSSSGEVFHQGKKRTFHQCPNCYGIFVDHSHLPSPDSEKQRYLKHNNDVDNPQYQEYAKPIVNLVLGSYNTSHLGLDFGAGTGPVIAKLLIDRGFSISLFDPFFHNEPSVLKKYYHYIICCEVVEHFHNPNEEFKLLNKLLLDGGRIYCMTHLYNDKIDFSGWWYKNDITHVFFYHQKTIEWIRQKYHFSDVSINNNLIIFTK